VSTTLTVLIGPLKPAVAALTSGPCWTSIGETIFFVHAARQNASALSLKWGRWMEDFALKDDAIRPASWIVEHNQPMRLRADLKGDLRASIMAALQANSHSVESESELARICGATRSAIAEALKDLRCRPDQAPAPREVSQDRAASGSLKWPMIRSGR